MNEFPLNEFDLPIQHILVLLVGIGSHVEGSAILLHLVVVDAVSNCCHFKWRRLSPDLLSLFRGSQLQWVCVIQYLSKELACSVNTGLTAFY